MTIKRLLPAFAILFSIIGISVFYINKYRDSSDNIPQDTANLREALYYKKATGRMVQCTLCPLNCVLKDGQRGLCKVRQNVGGKLYSLVYGHLVSANNDPIEKKPFFHVLPGTYAFSIATVGCNLRCLYCQNWEISQVFPEDVKYVEVPPQKVIDMAISSGSRSIAYTYSEPVVFYEYMVDVARIARQSGLKNVVVTSGYINPDPLRELCRYVDAIKVDFKGFSEGFYQKISGGHLKPVLEALKIIKEQGIWLEIVNLLVPGENDDENSVRQMVQWIRGNLGDSVPVHFTRFHPLYKLQNLPPTPEESVKRARSIALAAGLKYVYTGNIDYREGEATYSPVSKQPVIEREGFFVISNHLKNGRSPTGEKVPGIWE